MNGTRDTSTGRAYQATEQKSQHIVERTLTTLRSKRNVWRQWRQWLNLCAVGLGDRMLRVAVVVFFIALLPVHVRAETRIALLIGNEAYPSKIGRLANPHNDVALIGQALKSLGFDVVTVPDAGLGTLYQAVNAYARRLQAAGPSAVGFFYYSGHGASDGNTNYLIPVDVKTTETGELWDQSLRLTEITHRLKAEAGNAIHFVVFDACRNTLKLTQPGSRAFVQSKGFVPVAQESGMLMAYSTAENELASDVGADAGPYAKVLAEEIVKPGVEAVTMFRHVQVRVRAAIGQEPWLGFNALGEVHLAGVELPTATVTTAAPVASPSEAAEAWDRTKDTTSITMLETFIRRFGETYYGELAKARLEEIKLRPAANVGVPREYPDLATTDCQPGRAIDIAIRACSDIIAAYPTFAMAYAIRGGTYRTHNERESALSDFSKALELDPQNTFALARRFAVISGMGEEWKGQPDFERLIAINPTKSTDFDALGFAYANKKDYDRAITDYNRAIELDPKFALAYLNRGFAYANKKDYDRAITEYNRAIELDPKFASAYWGRGWVYAAKGDYDRAITDYNRAIELDPKFALAYFRRGFAYAKKKDYDSAITDYNRAIELDPKFALAYADRGFAYANKSNRHRAIADFRKALELDPNNTFAHDGLRRLGLTR